MIACLSLSIALNAQNIPIDFEAGGNGANWNWTVFENTDNPPLEIVSNPDQSGINTSATVAKFTARQSGNPWAGCETLHGAGIGSWTIDANNSTIRIMVWKDVISDVGIKLVRVDNWSLGEIKVPNTKVNQWEQITFDFSSHIGNTYDQIVIFPDFDLGGRSSDRVIYFDNVYGAQAGATGIEDMDKSDISIFPNPAKDIFNISMDKEIEEIFVFDYSGKLILQKEVSANETSINTSNFSKGVFVLKAMSSGEMLVKKIIVE